MDQQDNNFYDNQTPEPGNTKPDYSYNWDGTERNRNNRMSAGTIVGIVVLSIIIFFGACFGGFFVVNEYLLPGFDFILKGNDNLNGEAAQNNNSGNNSNLNQNGGAANNQSFEKPKFEYGDQADLSTDLTNIYASCAPSCCTIRVMVGNQLYSIGSGFVIDSENGYIATNHHVIDGGDKVEVVFYNGSSYTATIVGSNSITDLAVLKIEAEGLVALKFGYSDNVSVGENVVAIGTPYDQSLAGTMTCGIISGVARNIEITNDSGKVIKTMTLLQTDCSINPGNSGGPLIDMAGNVIGITSLKLVDEQFEGIGFAIPITAAADIFEKLIAGENIGENDLASAAPQIGVTVYELEAGLQAFRMYPTCDYPESGVLVSEISRDSAAYIAGLSVYDIIIDFDGNAVTCLDDLTGALGKYKAGDEVTVTVFRFNRSLSEGSELTITFILDAAK